jgi:beta-galactosidase
VGLRVQSSGARLEVSASHFTARDLERALHSSDLRPRKAVFLNLDFAQRGLGTASCGPDVLEAYRVRPGKYSSSMTLSPVKLE